MSKFQRQEARYLIEYYRRRISNPEWNPTTEEIKEYTDYDSRGVGFVPHNPLIVAKRFLSVDLESYKEDLENGFLFPCELIFSDPYMQKRIASILKQVRCKFNTPEEDVTENV